ncbi:ATP-binding protein [Pseudoalteromonas sp. CR1]|uniref:ATP-binding protein n=1 Tax=unclassified Pseudoalteromonas TaxID=194690 RepID=UPI0007302C4B|nr:MULTISPECIES: ATP-binding protein [unclassified Pseudoalteromonas]KTD91779.1 hypothetical protein ATS71_05775 [Pseudoalteromonas sp. H71]MBW4966043.1 ATP-binding protein [Pseudoalteromonas sp. CR1]
MDIAIEEPVDAYYVAQEARKLAFELGFNEFEAGMITIAVAEITTNVVRYALPGVATLTVIERGRGIQVTIKDNGPGITDLEKAMVDGFSTHSEPSIGKGLGSAKRCVEEFIVNKNDPSGLSITLRHYLTTPENQLEKVSISFPAIGNSVNGDKYFLKQYHSDKLFVCLIDGSGKGINASNSSQCALNIVKEHYTDDLKTIISLCHSSLKDNYPYRPVQIALLRISPDWLEYCVVGDLGIKIISDSQLAFPVNDGSVGLTLPSKIHNIRVNRPMNMTLFLYSDGIILPQDLKEIREASSLERSACLLFNEAALPDDDATLIVIRDKIL